MKKDDRHNRGGTREWIPWIAGFFVGILVINYVGGWLMSSSDSWANRHYQYCVSDAGISREVCSCAAEEMRGLSLYTIFFDNRSAVLSAVNTCRRRLAN
jgi:hypothetical protein